MPEVLKLGSKMRTVPMDERPGKIEALRLMRLAEEAGFSFEVGAEGVVDYKGPSAAAAWTHCKAVDEAEVVLRDVEGQTRGWLLVIPSLAPEETLADYAGKWINTQYGE